MTAPLKPQPGPGTATGAGGAADEGAADADAGAATKEATTGAGVIRRGRRVFASRAVWLLPAGAVLVALLLTALNLNGSSVEALGAHPESDPSLVMGHPRGIRSDEFLLTTPQLIGNDRRGLPVQPWVGLTRTFLPATSLGVPVAHWTTAFQPRSWAFFVLPSDRAFAWWWWWPLLIGFVGVYALAYQIGRRIMVAGALAVAVTLSPYTAWWSLSPALTAGALAASAACAIAGLRARRWWSAGALGLLAGWFAVGGAFALYPPWQISVAWVLVAAIVGVAIDDAVGWRRLAQVALPALAVVVPAMAVWAVQASPALQATAGTGYPGNRISGAGEAALQRLLDAPSSLWSSAGYWVAHALGVVPGERADTGLAQLNNASEISSTWLPLPLIAVVVVLVVWAAWHRRQPGGPGTVAVATDVPHRLIWTTTLVAAAELLILAWAVAPLPHFVGTVTLLNRVPGYRTPLALGLGLVVLMACGSGAVQGLRQPIPVRAVVVLGGVTSVAALVWGTEALNWNGKARPGQLAVTAVAAVVVAGFTLLLTRRRAAVLGAVLLAGGTAAIFVEVNPLTHGLGPLQRDPIVKALAGYVGDGRTLAAVYGDAKLSALVSSTGLQNLSGLTPYPDAPVWQRLDPCQKAVWNNYAKYAWVADPTRQQPVIEPGIGTQKLLLINPCAASTLDLGITVSVSATPLAGTCLTLVQTVHRAGGDVYVYRTTG